MGWGAWQAPGGRGWGYDYPPGRAWDAWGGKSNHDDKGKGRAGRHGKGKGDESFKVKEMMASMEKLIDRKLQHLPPR